MLGHLVAATSARCPSAAETVQRELERSNTKPLEDHVALRKVLRRLAGPHCLQAVGWCMMRKGRLQETPHTWALDQHVLLPRMA